MFERGECLKLKKRSKIEPNYHFSNRVFPSLDALQGHLCTALNKLSSNTGIVRSIMYFPHICVTCEKAG